MQPFFQSVIAESGTLARPMQIGDGRVVGQKRAGQRLTRPLAFFLFPEGRQWAMLADLAGNTAVLASHQLGMADQERHRRLAGRPELGGVRQLQSIA